ncbi:MAG: GTPase [Candidatus Methanomethylophilaceae archaeon]
MSPKQKRIPSVLSADELMDKAYSRAAKISKNGTNALDTRKKTALAKVTASGDIIISSLTKYVDDFPRLDKEEDFFPELVDLVIGLDGYKKSLGAVNWAAKRTEGLKNETLRNIRWTKDMNQVESLRRAFYGRLSSVIKRIDKDLAFLMEAKKAFRNLPAVEPDIPTAVIAGFPNVGKSRLVTVLSTAAPEVAPYPFTTKGIVIGHVTHGWRTYQIIDTPGLLDRTLDERNAIEKQAVLALKYLTDVIIFIIDPSETCGYDMEKQMALLRSVQEGFPSVPLLVLESKSDILLRDEPLGLPISVETGQNIEEMKDRLLAMLRAVPVPES